MDGFTIVDGVVLAVILISAILAYARGVVREILAIVGWAAAAIAAFYLTPMAVPLVQEIPVVSDIISGSCELSIMATFVIVFVVALILISIFVPLISGTMRRNAQVNSVDQGFGFLFGVLRGVLLVVVALIVYDRVLIGDPIPAVDDSRTVQVFAELQDQIEENIPEEAPSWIVARYEELVGDCGAPSQPITPEPAEAPAEGEPQQ